MPLNSFDDACNLALKFEKQFQELKLKTPKMNYKMGESSTSNSAPKDNNKDLDKKKEEEVVTSLQVSQEKLKPGQQKMKNTICYKCHGQGHMARDCKTNMFISLEEHYALINQKLAEKEQSRSSDDSDDMEVLNDPKAWDNLPMDEILDSATNKKERRDQVLNMRRGTNLQEGDYFGYHSMLRSCMLIIRMMNPWMRDHFEFKRRLDMK
ncbi:Branchpoint-bridging protein, partial [Bienertia sinuspersici]